MKIEEIVVNCNIESKFKRASDSDNRIFNFFSLKKLHDIMKRTQGGFLNPILTDRRILNDAFADDWEKIDE